MLKITISYFNNFYFQFLISLKAKTDVS